MPPYSLKMDCGGLMSIHCSFIFTDTLVGDIVLTNAFVACGRSDRFD